MSEQILERQLSREQLYQLRDDIRRTQEPFIQLLVDLYAVSLPMITMADGIVETTYSPDVEKKANEIWREMAKAIEMVSRYKPNMKGKFMATDKGVVPATQIVHWPGKDTPACDDHRDKLVGLAAVLGFAVSWTPCEGRICTNCENEAERKARL